MDPQDYYEQIFIPNFNDTDAHPLDIRHAFNAAIAAYHFYEHFWHHCPQNSQYYSKLRTLTNEHDYRKSLANKCPEFALIWDVADASRHAELRSSKKRELFSSDQIHERGGAFDSSFSRGFDIGRIVIEDNSGKEYDFFETLKAVKL
ncbi:MAG: hypothetical protein JRC92_09525, partial [Deltaproteobacteria bacterium]|nr:hypothetical protein [Deltaproteobacteria bacterium]